MIAETIGCEAVTPELYFAEVQEPDPVRCRRLLGWCVSDELRTDAQPAFVGRRNTSNDDLEERVGRVARRFVALQTDEKLPV